MLVTIWAAIIFVLGKAFGANKTEDQDDSQVKNKSRNSGKPVFLRSSYPLKKEIIMYRSYF